MWRVEVAGGQGRSWTSSGIVANRDVTEHQCMEEAPWDPVIDAGTAEQYGMEERMRATVIRRRERKLCGDEAR